MQAVTTIGLDIAKSIFQVHGVDAEGNAGGQEYGRTIPLADSEGASSFTPDLLWAPIAGLLE
jgi:hypothetical protein